MAFSPELEKAQKILQNENKNNILDKYSKSVDSLNDAESFIISTMKANICSTIGIKFEMTTLYVSYMYPSGNKLKKFDGYSRDSYLDLCKRVFKIDINEKYNCSRTINVDGVRTRVFAMMPPFVLTPNITISTTKEPPTKLNNQTISNEDWNTIVHSNFIIIGGSGAGKSILDDQIIEIKKRKNDL